MHGLIIGQLFLMNSSIFLKILLRRLFIRVIEKVFYHL
nr:MAG TPA: hypothetical protein [Bacteriophage sp.]